MIAALLNNPIIAYEGLPLLGTTMYACDEAIGHMLGWGMDRDEWDAKEKAKIKKHRNRGYNQYLHPPALIEGKPSHQWSWRRPIDVFTVWPSQAVTTGVTVSGFLSGGTTRLTVSGGTFYPSMVGKSVVVTGVGTFLVREYESAGAITVWGDARAGIRNGAFHADTDWTKDLGWLVNNGSAFSGGGAGANITQTIPPLKSGATYRVTYTVLNWVIGSVAAVLGTNSGTPRSANGTYTEDIVANGEDFKFTSNLFIGRVDDVSIGLTFSVASNGDYDLPDDFGGIDGPLQFGPDEGWSEVEIVGIGQILHERTRNVGSSMPRVAAITPKRTDQSAPSRFTLMLVPAPDKVYNLRYRYFPNKGELTESNPYPQGMHCPANAELLIESCLAVAERDENDVQDGLHSREFNRLLVAAIAADEKVSTPETLGPIYDRQMWSAPRGGRRDSIMANSGYIVTQNGIAWGT